MCPFQPKNYGFKCLVVGYESDSNRTAGLKNLEMELAYLGGTCAASLMKRNMSLSLRPTAPTATGEAEQDEDMEVIDETAFESYEMHHNLLSKGFALERPPSVNEAIDGMVPFSCNSNERLFLRNFVHCVPNTSGGRLARWLQPESYVDVDRCKVHYNVDELCCHWPTIITVVTCDQYADVVQVPNLKVEVKAVPIEDMNRLSSRLKRTELDAMTFGGQKPPNLEPKYEVTVKDKMFYHAITVQKCYDNYSFEELRYASPALQRQSENMLVRPNNDGTYSANWTPGNTGWYQVHVTIDGCDLSETHKVEVRDPPQGLAPPPHQESNLKKTIVENGIYSKLRKVSVTPSAGLRIRVHPTLQSEQIGLVPVDGTITVVDEICNSDGVWVRLGQDTLIEHVESTVYSEGWCMQYNKHLERTLLVPVPSTDRQEKPSKSAFNPAQARTSLDQPRPTKSRRRNKHTGGYSVVKCGASGHNIRSFPNMSAAPIGIVNLGSEFNVIAVAEENGETWVQLDQEGVNRYCFNSEGDGWSLAVSATNVQYLQSDLDKYDQEVSELENAYGNKVEEIGHKILADSGTTVKKSSFIPIKGPFDQSKPTPPPRHSIPKAEMPTPLSVVEEAANAIRNRTPSPSVSGDGRKPSFFQKLFKTDGGSRSRGASQSPPPQRKAVITANKDIPPELQGVSVKELVKVIGESRANGNGVTPPDTPRRQLSRSASPAVNHSPACNSSRSSSPSSSSVRAAGGAAAGAGHVINSLTVDTTSTGLNSPSRSRQSHSPESRGVGLMDLVRQDSFQSDTSALISSITKDLSLARSSRDGSASPLSLKSDNLRLSESPPRKVESKTLERPKGMSESAVSSPSMKKKAFDSKAKYKTLPRDSKPGLDTPTRKNRAGSLPSSKHVAIKEAISPSVAESIRSVFAAFVWHEGVVHDAMAIASYLKFHPTLTKQGDLSGEIEENNLVRKEQVAKQRHSVEVISASYLNPNAESLEKLGVNANANRNINSNRGDSFHQEACGFNDKAVGGTLPPTLKLFVMLWEEIRSYCVHAILQQFIVTSGQVPHSVTRKSSTDSKQRDRKAKRARRRCADETKPDGYPKFGAEDEFPNVAGAAVAVGAANLPASGGKLSEKEEVCQKCEMCGHFYPYPVTFHMKTDHPGCGGHAGGKGYNSGGHYCGGWAGNCGDGGSGMSTYYLICIRCRNLYKDTIGLGGGQMKPSWPDAPNKPSDASMNSRNQQNKVKSRRASNYVTLMSPLSSQKVTSPSTGQPNSHIIMNNNAMFLLDLASSSSASHLDKIRPMTNSQVMQTSNLSAVEELLPLDPNPFPLVPFQCFHALGVQDGHLRLINDELVLDEALKCSDESAIHANVKDSSRLLNVSDLNDREISPPEQFQTEEDEKKPMFGRSVSVGGGQDEGIKKRNSSCDNAFVEEGMKGEDFLSRPSPALKKLFTSPDPSRHNVLTDILQRPVMSFVLQWNDLESLQIAMTLALRKAACRSFAMQALNWLLRSVSQPACLHDLLWCFAAALENQLDDLSTTDEKNSKGKKRKEPPHPPVNGQTGLFDHPASDLRIAGEAIHPLPSTFHSLLQTISDLMLLLPVGSSLQQIAITCWGIKFKQTDHQFLHQSHVFSTISKILSRSEELDNITNQTAPSPSSFCEHEARVEKLTDISQSLELKVSSRPAMIVSLLDNSTETFWESGEEDRNKSKWISAALPFNATGGIKTISVHIDNCRDLGNKVANITFKGGKSADDLKVLKQADVESRFAGWLSCFVSNLKYVKIELKGPDNSLRLRQVKALGTLDQNNSSPASNAPISDQTDSLGNPDISVATSTNNRSKFFEPCSIQQRNCEAETLRVFRLITSQVFGRLLDRQETEVNEDDSDAVPSKEWEEQETYLKEHVVGILFSGSKLTHLQKQVCAHIVQAIKKEASRLRDDWEVSLCSGENGATAGEISTSPDTYCFEMLSLVLALSGSSVGRNHLASQFSLMQDLLTLLHTGSARIQRQVIALLRRVLPHVTPDKFGGLLGISSLPPRDFGILAAACRSSSEGSDVLTFNMHKQGILDVFLSCVAKSLTLQVKVKGGMQRDSNQVSKNPVSTVSLATSIHPRDQIGARWWMRGSLPKNISEDVIVLLKDMTDGKLSEDWSAITKSAIAENILNLTRLEGKYRDSAECLRHPVVWLALASLCVLDNAHVEGLSSGEWSGKTGASDNPRPTCDNHDDGETLAIIMCDSCGNLCGDCDRFLHLHRKTRSHQRQVFKEEEEAIKVDLHEGCGRAKLFWIMALADSSTLKAMVEFRDGGRNKTLTAGTNSFLTCRFCGTQSNLDTPVINGVCSDKECLHYSKTACQITLPCGHFCGGIADETTCLPCLHGCSGFNDLKQDADDMCMICFTDALSPIPSIQLDCGHVFHHHCCAAVLEKRWIGPRITFGFRNCPICKTKISHVALKRLIDPIDALFDDVKKKSLMRLEYEGLTKCEAIEAKGARFYNDAVGFALERYAYYVCFKCGKAYFGGEAQCDADAGLGDDYNPEELVCGGCSDVSRAQMCLKHGTDYLEYKCRYCCSVAVFFCFGNTHFCNACHDDFQRVANVPKHSLPQCPVGPKLRQLEGDECPLHVNHPPTGEEFALGCGICRNAHTF